MILRCFLFFISFVWTVTIAYGQDKNVTDSLLLLLQKKNLDAEVQFKVYQNLAYYHTDFQEGLYYAKQAFNVALVLGDSFKIAKANEEIGLKNRILGNKKEAFDASFKAAGIYKKLNRPKYLAASYTQIGSNYIIDKEYKLATDYLRNALEIYQNVAIDSFRQAMTHINLGEVYRLIERHDSASFHFRTALVLNRTLNNNTIEGYALGNLGMVHVAQDKLIHGIEEMEKAILILEKLGDAYSVSVYEAEIGNALLVQHKTEGLQRIEKALEIATTNALKEQIRDFSKMMVDFYQTTEDYEQALYYQQQYQVYQDSLVNKDNVQKIEQLKSQYELNKRETEISFLNRAGKEQQKVAYMLAIGAGLFVLLSVLLYYNNRLKRKANSKLEEQKSVIKTREEEKGLLLRELNHRVKNNLQMVSSLMNLQLHQLKDHPSAEVIRSGKFRVEAMSLIHQKLYSEDHTTQIAIKEYIEELSQNLVYSYNQKVELVLKIEPLQLAIDLAIPIGLIINELVTNALKYAFENVTEPSLELSLYKESSTMYLNVKDNGTGMLTEGHDKAFGLKLVRSLIDQIDGEINSVNNEGVSCVIKVPLV